MARPPPPSSYTYWVLRQTPKSIENYTHQLRNIGSCGGSKEFDKPQQLSEVVKEICATIRSKPRWEQTLLSEFPTVNFLDSSFLNEVLRLQNNSFLSIRVLNWLSSRFGFSPEKSTCSLIFDALVEDKAPKAAKNFLHFTGFVPESAHLEAYARCLCESRMMEDALEVFDQLKKMDTFLSLETWNCLLLGSVQVRRTDIFWQLYGEMIECGVTPDVDTVDYLIQAFCVDKKVSKGYEVLRQVLKDGHVPHKAAFDNLLFGLFKCGSNAKASALLHIMIAKGYEPDIYTYQQVIHGLCMRKKPLEGLRIFNDLKDRGYAPDKIMYTTMIHGLCKMKRLGDARKLWFEMIQKGIEPNQCTYSTLIYGYCKLGNITEALNLYKEMCDRGFRESTVIYNTMINGLCSHGKTAEAFELFEQMAEKGVARDVITYNSLIWGFCKEGKLAESFNLLHELLEQGLWPSSPSFGVLIKKLCWVGRIDEAKTLWKDMLVRGVEPASCINDCIILALSKEGHFGEGLYWLIDMVKHRLIPQRETFEKLFQILAQDKLDNGLMVLGYMLKIGYTPTKGYTSEAIRQMRLLFVK